MMLPFVTLILFRVCISASSYIVVNDITCTWPEARDYCVSTFGTSLATIVDATDAQTAITALEGFSNAFWIGLNDLNPEGTWTFVDGTDCGGNCDTLDAWEDGEPNNLGDEDCAEIPAGDSTLRATDSLFNDIPCTYPLPFLCNSPGECGPNLKLDPVSGQCVRDCSTFAIDEYLGCSTTYNTDQGTIGGLIDGLRSDVTVVQTTVNTDFGPRITANEGSITQIVGTTIPDLESNFEPRITKNTEDIAQIVTVTIPALENNFEPRVTKNTEDITQINSVTIPDLELRLDPKITTNTEDITQINSFTIPDLEQRLDPRITTNTEDIAQIVTVTIPALENNFEPRITKNTGDISQIVSITIPDLETSLDTRVSALENTVNIDYAPRIADNGAQIIALRDTTIPALVNSVSALETELRALIQANYDEIEALRPVSGASAGSVLDTGLNGNGYGYTSEDWMLFSLVVANVGLMCCSLALCLKLRKGRAYAKIANYASELEMNSLNVS